MAGYRAFRDYGQGETATDRIDRYQTLWAFWAGEWRADAAIRSQRRSDPRLYENTRLLWNIARSTVRLYAQTVYQGALSTDGKPLPDGSRGAIPIDPQTGSEATDDALLAAAAEFWSMTRWRQHMSLAPKYSAILGDVLIELVDDVARGRVDPEHVWPGHVVALELDLVGNVKAYAVEKPITIAASTAFGRQTSADRYVFRKEVDGETFRYYRDGKPAAFPALGIQRAVEENPYGFVPAVWCRHELVFGDRGLGAFEPALNVLREQNSVLSHALDFSRKKFAAPIGVIGAALPRRGALTMPRIAGTGDPVLDAEQAAETHGLLPMNEQGRFVTVDFDVGRTGELLDRMDDRLLAEFPEALFFQELLKMTQLTAPGVERAMGPIIGNVRQARANHDPQTVKLHQMVLAMMGWRLNNGDYPEAIVAARPGRYEQFRPFDLDSYGRGLLDMEIAERPVIPETADEIVDRLVKIQLLETAPLWRKAGIEEEVIAEVFSTREADRERMDVALTGIAAMPDMAAGEMAAGEMA